MNSVRHTTKESTTTKNGVSGENHACLDLTVYREVDLQKQTSLLKKQLKEIRTANESTQAKLLDHSQRQGLVKQLMGVRSYTDFCRS